VAIKNNPKVKKVYSALRPALVKNGATLAQAAQVKQSLSVKVAPVGYIKVAQLHVACKAAYVPVNKMVKAIGGDRNLMPVAHPICTPVIVNNVRYVNAWLSTKNGLNAILTGNYAQAPKAQAQAQAPKAPKAPKV
jgi:hypothetical protein